MYLFCGHPHTCFHVILSFLSFHILVDIYTCEYSFFLFSRYRSRQRRTSFPIAIYLWPSRLCRTSTTIIAFSGNGCSLFLFVRLFHRLTCPSTSSEFNERISEQKFRLFSHSEFWVNSLIKKYSGWNFEKKKCSEAAKLNQR